MIPEYVEEPVVRVVRDVAGSAANAGASTQTFDQGGFGGGLSGSAANAAASTQTFNQGGFGGGFGASGSSANAGK